MLIKSRGAKMTQKQNFLIVTAIVILYSLICIAAFPQTIDITRIIQIESSGNPHAVGSAGERGLMQISGIVLQEWNDFHPKQQYSSQDLFNPIVNVLIGQWYINERIPQMLKHFDIEDTTANRIIAYNSGIATLVYTKAIPKTTRVYIEKYKAKETKQ